MATWMVPIKLHHGCQLTGRTVRDNFDSGFWRYNKYVSIPKICWLTSLDNSLTDRKIETSLMLTYLRWLQTMNSFKHLDFIGLLAYRIPEVEGLGAQWWNYQIIGKCISEIPVESSGERQVEEYCGFRQHSKPLSVHEAPWCSHGKGHCIVRGLKA